MSIRHKLRLWMTRLLESRGYVVQLPTYPSETSKHRTELAPFCSGYGCDIGFGGDPILNSSIRVDLPEPYASTGTRSVQLGGDCGDLYWFRDSVLDYIYSSHVIEDFDEPKLYAVLREWGRVLKPGAHLVLLQPDQQRYLATCNARGDYPNQNHALDHFSLEYLRTVFARLSFFREVAAFDQLGEYSFAVVLEKRDQDETK